MTRVKRIIGMLRQYGERFTGHNPQQTAAEWAATGMTYSEISEWLEIGVWDADTADTFSDYLTRPEAVKAAAEKLIEVKGAAAFTDHCPIYAVCNGDLLPEELLFV